LIGALPEHEQAPARLYYLEGLPQREIAEFLGVPATTIKKRLYASRQRLKARLNDLRPLDRAIQEDLLPLDVQLFAAARNGFVRRVESILRQSPQLVHAVNEDGLSVLLYAAHAEHHSGSSHVSDFLLSRGALIDLPEAAALGMRDAVLSFLKAAPHRVQEAGAWGRTALHWAVSRGELGLTQLLVARGARVESADRWGCTPLHLAAELGRVDTVRWLLNHGADVHARLRNGKTVLHVAAQSRHPEVLRCLVDYGAQLDAFAAAALGLKDTLFDQIRRDRDTVHARLPFGATPLHVAAESGQEDLAELLVDAGAELDVVCAAELGWKDHLRELLGDRPENVQARGGSFGFTPLHSATTRGRGDLARLLLLRGAEVNATDQMYRKTPLGEALYFGNESMARLLYAHGGRPAAEEPRTDAAD
jgi:ankyrin repeat protein